MGGKKKLSLKQMERMQDKKDEQEKRKKKDKTGSTKEKPSQIVPPDSRNEKIINELKKMKVLTPYSVASRLNIRISAAKDFLEQLEEEGAVKMVSGDHNIKIYGPMNQADRFSSNVLVLLIQQYRFREQLEFPDRIYTTEEIKKAIESIKTGHKHRLRVKGAPNFKEKVRQALKLVKTAGYYTFLRTYIRSIVEIDGLTQLREADASIWASKYAVENAVDAASLLVQKANHMKEYLEGEVYYGGVAETRSVQKRIEFIKMLKQKSGKTEVRDECESLLRRWSDSVFL